MKAKMLNLLRRAIGTQQIAARLDRMGGALRSGESPHAQAASGLEVLPGTEYSRIAIPLDYPPSRAFAPRYGYSHGTIEPLVQWFGEHNAQYREFLSFMRTLNIGHIPVTLSAGAPLAPAWVGGAICAFDSLALYAMVQKYRPRTYIEIGSGMTTCFARQSIRDAKLETRVVSIDPEPRREVDAICDEVIRDGLETCDLGAFDRLQAGDILFFDGSHRSFMNSDVTVFFIDVLPRLQPGVVVHIHDINLPWDYPESFRDWYWNEQYMLAIYLMMGRDKLNPLFPTTWVTRGMSLGRDELPYFVDLGSPETNLSWLGGGSMWFTKTAK